MLKLINKISFLIPLLFLFSCSENNTGFYYAYFNYNCVASCIGDIQGRHPRTGEILRSVKGFIDYSYLFNREVSYFNCKCTGSNFDDFHCESVFHFESFDGSINIHREFNSRTDGGSILILDSEAAKEIGIIYIGTYSCRWALEFDVNGDGVKEPLVCEFYKKSYNELPSFVKDNYYDK